MQVSCDTLWGGRLTLWQPARGHGYRFNLDPILLAGFESQGQHVLDLGAGCGIVGLLLLASGKAQYVTAVERQPGLAALAVRNASVNGLEGRLRVIQADVRDIQLSRVDRVVFNPPYFPRSQGQACPEPGRDQARRELHGTLADFVACARRHVKSTGCVSAIVRIHRADELEALGHAWGLSIYQRRDVQSRQGQAARHTLLQMVPSTVFQRAQPHTPKPHSILPPLVVHLSQGHGYTSEVAAMLGGSGGGPGVAWSAGTLL